jgi:hypothetical protein
MSTSQGPNNGPPELPAGWVAYWSKTWNRYYFYNQMTGDVVWKIPEQPLVDNLYVSNENENNSVVINNSSVSNENSPHLRWTGVNEVKEFNSSGAKSRPRTYQHATLMGPTLNYPKNMSWNNLRALGVLNKKTGRRRSLRQLKNDTTWSRYAANNTNTWRARNNAKARAREVESFGPLNQSLEPTLWQRITRRKR